MVSFTFNLEPNSPTLNERKIVGHIERCPTNGLNLQTICIYLKVTGEGISPVEALSVISRSKVDNSVREKSLGISEEAGFIASLGERLPLPMRD